MFTLRWLENLPNLHIRSILDWIVSHCQQNLLINLLSKSTDLTCLIRFRIKLLTVGSFLFTRFKFLDHHQIVYLLCILYKDFNGYYSDVLSGSLPPSPHIHCFSVYFIVYSNSFFLELLVSETHYHWFAFHCSMILGDLCSVFVVPYTTVASCLVWDKMVKSKTKAKICKEKKMFTGSMSCSTGWRIRSILVQLEMRTERDKAETVNPTLYCLIL